MDIIWFLMQLLSIENLSLAAEVIAVLLLLAFAWPPKSIKPASESLGSANWEPAKCYFLQSSLHRGLYLQHWQEKQNRSPSVSVCRDPFTPTATVDEAGRSNVPLPWQDRLTGLINRNGFDAILNAWLAIEPQNRGESCLSMVTLSEFSELVSLHGAMVTEQALRSIASQLAVASSSKSLIAKYLPDRFLVLHFSSGVEASFRAMKNVQKSISEPGFFNVAGNPISLVTLVSIVGLDGDSSVESRMDELEEGAMEASDTGRNIVSKVEGTWTDSPVETESVNRDDVLGHEAVETLESQPLIGGTVPINSIGATSANHLGNLDSIVEIKTTTEAAENVSCTSNDISAVANPDDIAALFEQINSNKLSKLENVKDPTNDAPAPTLSSATAPPMETQSSTPEVVDTSALASADDIISLFASVKPAMTPATAS